MNIFNRLFNRLLKPKVICERDGDRGEIVHYSWWKLWFIKRRMRKLPNNLWCYYNKRFLDKYIRFYKYKV
jgi:hypothetical protein